MISSPNAPEANDGTDRSAQLPKAESSNLFQIRIEILHGWAQRGMISQHKAPECKVATR